MRLLREMKKFFAKVFVWSHRWFGLTAGLYFVLLGLSGSYLVYDDTIDRFFKPELWHSSSSSSATNLNWNQLITVAQEGLQTKKTPFMVRVSGDVSQNARVLVDTSAPGEERQLTAAFVDLSTTQMRGSEVPSETVTGFIFSFHHDLFWGGTGRTIMGVSGLLMCFILLSGLYLWWPKGRSFLSGFKLRKWRSFLQMNLELHKLSGLYTLVLMLVVTATGTYISKPNWFMPQPAPRADASKPAGDGDRRPKDFDWVTIQASMEKEFGANLRPLFIRVNAKGGTAAVMAWPGGEEVRRVFNADGTVKPEEKRDSTAQAVRAVNHDLHVGHFWSWFGEFLIFVSGLLPLFFYVTGFIVWRKKAQIKKSRPPTVKNGAHT